MWNGFKATLIGPTGSFILCVAVPTDILQNESNCSVDRVPSTSDKNNNKKGTHFQSYFEKGISRTHFTPFPVSLELGFCVDFCLLIFDFLSKLFPKAIEEHNSSWLSFSQPITWISVCVRFFFSFCEDGLNVFLVNSSVHGLKGPAVIPSIYTSGNICAVFRSHGGSFNFVRLNTKGISF